MAKILIGTSGYDYDDWEGVFYPHHMKKEDYLGYYAGQFSTVEINQHTSPQSSEVCCSHKVLDSGYILYNRRRACTRKQVRSGQWVCNPRHESNLLPYAYR